MREGHDFQSELRRLEATNLSLTRNGAVLLDIESLRFYGNGPTLILGPNGAGKSLLLRCLHGLENPDRGEIRQGGRLLDNAARARQAMVFQQPVLLRRTVQANLEYVLRRQGLDRSTRGARCAELLALGGLETRARQGARSLSGGEAQRLAVLRALAATPAVLFLDEPSSALDPASTKALEALVQQAHARGTRVIMVTHDVGQARRLAADVLVLHRGQVMEHTPAAEFFNRPRSRAARCFLDGRLIF